jgi:hypothetical protein
MGAMEMLGRLRKLGTIAFPDKEAISTFLSCGKSIGRPDDTL